MFPLVRELKKLKSRLFQDTEIQGGQIYEFIMTRSPEVIKYVKNRFYNHQSISEKHQPGEERLVEEKPADSYSKLISSIDDYGD